MQNEYRCTRNACYAHDCIGHDDLTARQGYYIWASSQEEALQKMAVRFPEEISYGFTAHEWKSFNVIVEQVNHLD